MPNLTNINVYSQSNWQNISTTEDSDLNFVEAHVVVETYKSGTSWYQLYDDKFIIQGGRINNTQSYNSYTKNVTYLKPFVDTNYTILSNAFDNNNGTWQIATRIASDITTTQCTIRGGRNADNAWNGPALWVAFGYIQ